MMIEEILNKLEQDPENLDLLCEAGKGYKKTGQFEKARQYFARAIDTDSTYTPAYCCLINLYLDFGNYQQGFYEFEQALKHFTDNNKSIATLFNALFANFLLHRLPDRFEPDGVSHNYEEYFFKMGEIFRANELYEAAVKVYEACYDLSHSNIRMLLNLAECYHKLEKYSHAERVLLEAFRESELDPDVLLGLANTYYKAEYYECCIEYCQKYLAIDPKNLYIQNMLAYCYVKEGSIISATNIYETQVKTIEKKLLPLKNLYIVYKLTANHEKAQEIYNTIKVNYPSSMEVLNTEFSKSGQDLLDLIEI